MTLDDLGDFDLLPSNLDSAQFNIKKKKINKTFLLRYFFSESNFCLITSHFFSPISKMFYNLSVKLNMAKCRPLFMSVFGPETKEKNKLKKKQYSL